MCSRWIIFQPRSKTLIDIIITEFILEKCFLPENDPEFKMVPDGTDKFRANKIIFGKRYSLFDPNTYTELGLDITTK